MDTVLELHDLPTPKRAGELAKLVEALYSEGCRIVVWVADDSLRQVFDDYLWTASENSFVPHIVWTPVMGSVEDPVVLVGDEANPNKATTLVVADDYPPADWARGFEAVHDVIPPGEAGTERRAWWEQWRRGEEI